MRRWLVGEEISDASSERTQAGVGERGWVCRTRGGHVPVAVWTDGRPSYGRSEKILIFCLIGAIADDHLIRLRQTVPRLVKV